MARRPLTVAQVDALKKHGTHWVAPPGLYLQVKPNGARSWLLRYSAGGKAHWHGLGAARDVGLREARQAAEDMRTDIRRGRDPIAERRAAKATVAPRSVPTFQWCADQFIASHEAGWKNAKHRAQWESTLKTHAGPIIGNTTVDRIGVDDVFKVLDPIWRSMPETASRLRGRIESVLGWAAAKGYRDAENPARWKGGPLEHLLPAIGRVHKVKPRESVPYAEVPALMKRLDGLRTANSASSRALRFTILTAVRTAEALGARWEEFDFVSKTWTIPASRMKAGTEHIVPLSDAAIALLGDPAKTGYVFPGARPRKPLSNMAMLMVLRGVRDDGATVHGFRSSFRTWAADSGHPREVAEMCLAHATGSAVELAYQRSDYLAQRRVVMKEWSTFLTGV